MWDFFPTHLSWFVRRVWCSQVRSWSASGRSRRGLVCGRIWVRCSVGRGKERCFWVRSSLTAPEQTVDMVAVVCWLDSSLLCWGLVSGSGAPPERQTGRSNVYLLLFNLLFSRLHVCSIVLLLFNLDARKQNLKQWINCCTEQKPWTPKTFIMKCWLLWF